MVRSTVCFKLKQNNGEITEYKKVEYTHDSYDKFLEETEDEINRISSKFGRHCFIEIVKFDMEEEKSKSKSKKTRKKKTTSKKKSSSKSSSSKKTESKKQTTNKK